MSNMPAEYKQSLRFSFWDGFFASGMVGFTQSYFTPFLLLLGGGAGYVGALSALPNLFASVIQLKSPRLSRKFKHRKTMVVFFVFLQALFLLPMVWLALSYIKQPFVLICFVVFYTICGALATPPWGSMMSDLVPEDKRGDYFGWRNRILGFITVASTFLAGFILHKINKFNPAYGFAFIFACACVFRLVSCYFLGKMYEPAIEHEKERNFDFSAFFIKLKNNHFARFVIYVFFMMFSVQIAAPFFAVFMIEDLSFDYLTYTTMCVAESLFFYFIMRRWGRHADKVGNIKIIKVTGYLLGIIPALWFFNLSPYYLFFAQMFSGFAWAGFNLCISNYVYDTAPPEKRTRYISYLNFVIGIAICLGSQTGGLLLNILPPFLGYKILTLYLISSILRFAVGFIMPSNLKEVKAVSKTGSIKLLLSVLYIKPIGGLKKNDLWRRLT